MQEFYAVTVSDFEKHGEWATVYPKRLLNKLKNNHLSQMSEDEAKSVRVEFLSEDGKRSDVTRELAAQMSKNAEFNWSEQSKDNRDYRSAVMWVDGFTKIWAEDELEARFNEEYNDSFEI